MWRCPAPPRPGPGGGAGTWSATPAAPRPPVGVSNFDVNLYNMDIHNTRNQRRHPVAINKIKVTLRLGLEEKKTLDQEMKMLSVVIQKGNASMLVGRQIFPANEVNIPDVNVLI